MLRAALATLVLLPILAAAKIVAVLLGLVAVAVALPFAYSASPPALPATVQPLDLVRRLQHHGGHISSRVRDLARMAAQFVGVVGHGLASGAAASISMQVSIALSS